MVKRQRSRALSKGDKFLITMESMWEALEGLDKLRQNFHRKLLRCCVEKAREEGIPLSDYLNKLTKEMKEAMKDGEAA